MTYLSISSMPLSKLAEYLSLRIDQQLFGIPVLQIQDVLREQSVTRIPLAPDEISGALNLRGRIVTSINMRKRLGLPRADNTITKRNMSVVVEHDQELFSLVIDKVGDVLELDYNAIEALPSTLDPVWASVAAGVCRLEGQLLVILDIERLLETKPDQNQQM